MLLREYDPHCSKRDFVFFETHVPCRQGVCYHAMYRGPVIHATSLPFLSFSPRSLVFRMVEAEEEYVDQLETLISCFLRPFKMAASSKNPPCNHEDINSIFLAR